MGASIAGWSARIAKKGDYMDAMLPVSERDAKVNEIITHPYPKFHRVDDLNWNPWVMEGVEYKLVSVNSSTNGFSLHCGQAGYGIRCNSVHPGHVLKRGSTSSDRTGRVGAAQSRTSASWPLLSSTWRGSADGSRTLRAGSPMRSAADARPARSYEQGLVRSRRLELPRPFGHNDLNVARLPVPPRPHSQASAGNRRRVGARH